MSHALHVTGVGNAIVDVIAHADDALLHKLGLPKGGMTLVDSDKADALYAQMGPAIEVSGGSVANSMAGLASLGGAAGYVGKVKDDQLGHVFAHDIRAAGVDFATTLATGGSSTARCLIFVTPDGQRTMATYLGACAELSPQDIDPARIEKSAVTYLEGFLWDPPLAKEAMLKAADLAHAAGRRVALSLSDAFCVDRHRAEFKRLIEDHVDVLFANESELLALTEQPTYEAGAAAIREKCELTVLTRGPRGAIVLAGRQTFEVPAAKVTEVVDTTGAGDLFAAGFLYGITHAMSPHDSARLGTLCAAEVIGHYGARPDVSLKALMARELG